MPANPTHYEKPEEIYFSVIKLVLDLPCYKPLSNQSPQQLWQLLGYAA